MSSKSKSLRSLFLSLFFLSVWLPAAFAQTNIARVWDEQALAAIRIDLPNPPVHARNLFHFSVAMYDAWAAYDSNAVGYVYRGKFASTNLLADRNQAISYAAYRILSERYALSKNAATTLPQLDAEFSSLGYDKNNTGTNTATPAGVGNAVAAAVSSFFLQDGALQTQQYKDYPTNQGGYAPVNPPLDVLRQTPFAVDPNRWQPLYITNSTSQNGIPASVIQGFLGSQWLGVRPFALARASTNVPWFDPGPPPHLNGAGDAQYRSECVDLIRRSSQLTPDSPATIDISPGAFGNNTLGANDGTGHPVNPATGQPYASNVVKIGDFSRVLAEFWADGPNSETPPGHWNVFANYVSDNPALVKRIGGTGPVVDDLEWAVKLYFTINASVHDAACAAWSLKRIYDGWRPIEAIRYMASFGQSSDPNGPSYHTNGLPLVTNLIEVVTPATAAAGGKHQGLPVGAIALYVWPIQHIQNPGIYAGVQWVAGTNWYPYQRITFVTPSFPGYISGHSTFSRAGAEVLAAFTGTPYFPGGLGVYNNYTLTFEQGPSQPVNLQWATYFDAADQAGLSRLWGGIHVSADDLSGRIIGAQCGRGAWALARQYFDGSVAQAPITLSIQPAASGVNVSYNSLRGLYYKLQTTPNLSQSFTDAPAGFLQALDSPISFPDTPAGSKYYRILSRLSP